MGTVVVAVVVCDTTTTARPGRMIKSGMLENLELFNVTTFNLVYTHSSLFHTFS